MTNPTDQSGWHLCNRRFIAAPPPNAPLWQSHAQCPTVLVRPDGHWTVFVAGRDGHNLSRVFAVDIDAETFAPTQFQTRPVLDLGAAGAFDEHGVGAGTVLEHDGKLWLFYTGVRRQDDVPYRPGIGLAISTDGGHSFCRATDEPIIGPAQGEPLGAVTATVSRTPQGWVMRYSAIRTWRMVDGQPEAVYDIRGARSQDGVIWVPEPDLTLGFEAGKDGGLIRSHVFDTSRGPRMILAERGWRDFRAGQSNGYHMILARIGANGCWQRTGERVMPAPARDAQDWDNDMQCYPWLVEDRDRRMVVYNGNDFGRYGFGMAELLGPGD